MCIIELSLLPFIANLLNNSIQISFDDFIHSDNYYSDDDITLNASPRNLIITYQNKDG